jgi:hypothetical protein
MSLVKSYVVQPILLMHKYDKISPDNGESSRITYELGNIPYGHLVYKGRCIIAMNTVNFYSFSHPYFRILPKSGRSPASKLFSVNSSCHCCTHLVAASTGYGPRATCSVSADCCSTTSATCCYAQNAAMSATLPTSKRIRSTELLGTGRTLRRCYVYLRD